MSLLDLNTDMNTFADCLVMNNPLNDEYIALLAEEGNGAVETHLPEKKPLLVVLNGGVALIPKNTKSMLYGVML
jgi:hypothetical protein